MKKVISSIEANASSILSNSLLIVGLGSLFYGIHLIHPPSAFITVGSLVIGLAVLPLLPKGGK